MRALHPFLDHPAPIPFAHRGGAGEGKENSLEAFLHARSLGYRYIETDLRTTDDGTTVVTHDATHHASTGTSTLADVFDALPDVYFNIDPKDWRSTLALATFLDTRQVFDRVCVGSFSRKRLHYLRHEFGDRLCTSSSPIEVTRFVFGLPVPGNALQVPRTIKGRELVNERFVRKAHARGMKVHVWTIDDPDEMHELLDLGVDGIMTDRPSVLKNVFQNRGLWIE